MSIIHDALKKVEQAQNVKAQNVITPENHSGHGRKNNFIFVIFAVVFGLFTLNLLLKYSPDKAVKKVVQPLPVEAKLTSFSESFALKTSNKTVSLVLNGVFLADNEWFALINNQIVKKGQEINGAVLKNISFDEVELDSQGSILKLSNQQK
ncbi:MAG: hypothetical protein HZC15_00825 [Candidatus Omnitrophica bacterium]|nr:hypothetical protein [Candidatus Omnitrophota bacterium]